MKLKTALILVIIACVLGVAHYNEQITISITLPSIAQIVDVASKAISELKESTDTDYINIETHDNNQHSSSIFNENCTDENSDIYRGIMHKVKLVLILKLRTQLAIVP